MLKTSKTVYVPTIKIMLLSTWNLYSSPNRKLKTTL